MNQDKSKTATKILLIEDDEPTIKTIKFVLEREGYVVSIARDGEEALKMLDQEPDAILLDLVMPRRNGSEVLKIIRQEKCLKTPVIILSNLSKNDDVRRAMELGASDYLIKNELSIGVLVQKIKATLRKISNQ